MNNWIFELWLKGEKKPTISVPGFDKYSLENLMSRRIQYYYQSSLLDSIRPDEVYNCSLPGQIVTIGKRKIYHLYTTYNKNIAFSETDCLNWNFDQIWTISSLNRYDEIAYNRLCL